MLIPLANLFLLLLLNRGSLGRILLGLLILASATAAYFYVRIRREESGKGRSYEDQLNPLKALRNREAAGDEEEDRSFTFLHLSEPSQSSSVEKEAATESRQESSPVIAAQDPSSKGPETAETAAPAPSGGPPTPSVVIVETQSQLEKPVPHAEQIVITGGPGAPPVSGPESVTSQASIDAAVHEEPRSPLDTAPLDPRAIRPIQSTVLGHERLPDSSKRILQKQAQFSIRDDVPAAPEQQREYSPRAAARESVFQFERESAAETATVSADPASVPSFDGDEEAFGGLHIFADPRFGSEAAKSARENSAEFVAWRTRRRRNRVIALTVVLVLAAGGAVAYKVPASRQWLQPRIGWVRDQLAIMIGLKPPPIVIQPIPRDVEWYDYRLKQDYGKHTFEFGGEVTNVTSADLFGLRVEIELGSRKEANKTEVRVLPVDPPALRSGMMGTFHFSGSSEDYLTAKVRRVLGPSGEPLPDRYKGIKDMPEPSPVPAAEMKSESK